MTEHQGREEPCLTRVGRGAQGLGTRHAASRRSAEVFLWLGTPFSPRPRDCGGSGVISAQHGTCSPEEAEHVGHQGTNEKRPIRAESGTSRHRWTGSAICEARHPPRGRWGGEPVTSDETDLWGTQPGRPEARARVACLRRPREDVPGHSTIQTGVQCLIGAAVSCPLPALRTWEG